MIRMIAAVALAMCAMPAAAKWREAETRQFRVYSEGSESDLVERAELLERYDRLLRIFTGVSMEAEAPKLNVYMTNYVTSIGNLGADSAAGFYVASTKGICAFASRRSGFTDDSVVLLHEYAHHFMMQHFPVAYPAWYVEGFAEYFSTARIDGDTVELGRFERNRAYSLQVLKWLPIATILTGKSDLTGDEVHSFYGQSWLLAHMILQDSELNAKMPDYLTQVAAGVPSVEAFAAAFGSTRAFDARLRDYFDRGRITYRRLDFSEGEFGRATVAVSDLPDAAERGLLPAAAIRCGVGDSKEWLKDVRAVEQKYPDTPFARRIGAMAEAEAGDPARAIAKLQPMIAAEPDNADYHFWMGRAYSRRAHQENGDMAENHALARKSYGRAFEIRPDHWQTLLNYVADSQTPNGKAEQDILIAARDLAPQVGEINTRLGMSLALEQRFEEAATVLTPVANSPHGEVPEAVRKLLALIAARDTAIDAAALEVVTDNGGDEAGDDEDAAGS